MQTELFNSKIFNWILILLTIGVLGFIDYQTGIYFQFFLFYFLPVTFAAYKFGFINSLIVSFLSATVWYITNILAENVNLSPTVNIWNTSVRLITFITIGWTIAALTDLLKKERQLSEKMRTTLAEIKVLQGLLPICAGCKKIRGNNGRWDIIEKYIQENSNAEFTHGICPDCSKEVLKEAGLLKRENI